MALDSNTLQTMIDKKVEDAGFKFNDKSSFKILSQAIAEAVVEHIQANAEADVTSGSSSGKYKIK
jgi:hypothetical protein